MVVLVGNWWSFVLRGIFAILFGVLCFILPGMALLTLIYMFGIFALADGILRIIAAFRRSAPQQQPWWALLIGGIFSIIAGVIAFFSPGITTIALLYLIAAWALVTGGFEIAAAIRLRKQIDNEWILVLSGVLSIIFGVMLFIFPGAGALAMVWWIGIYAIIFGALMISLGVKLRSWIRRTVDQIAHGFPHGVAPGH
jgi:uncharacterized membrane protein HdeD (DUF308 family)